MDDNEKRTIEWAIAWLDNTILCDNPDECDFPDIRDSAESLRDELMYLIADKVIINGKVIRDRSK